MLIESQGEISLRTSSPSGGDIITTYKGKDLRLHYLVTNESGEFTGQKWYLQYAQSSHPPYGTGWIPYAADTRNGMGVFLWRDIGTETETWEAIGFSLETGEMTGIFRDNGSFSDLQDLKERYLRGEPTYNDNGGEDVRFGPDATESEKVYSIFDDIINPQKAAAAQPRLVSKPDVFAKKSADIITNYNPKTDQPIQIDLGSFDGAVGKLKIAKNSKKVPKLAKKEIDFIYDSQAGYLYFNQNGMQPDFGKGGIFAILEGKPRLGIVSFDFI